MLLALLGMLARHHSPCPQIVYPKAPLSCGAREVSGGRAAEFALPFQLLQKNYFWLKQKSALATEQVLLDSWRGVIS